MTIAVLAVVLCVAAVSLAIRLPAANPGSPLLEGAQVDSRVLAILRRSCADCHSEATTYPWYSYVAPFSILIRSDVTRGREHLNLSRWAAYPLVRKERSLSEIANQVKDRDMPLAQYTLIHRNARLSGDEVDAVFRWTQTERARIIAASVAGR